IGVSIFSGGDDDRPTVGVVGSTSLQETIGTIGDTIGSPVEVSAVADADTGRDLVTSGELDVALIPGDGNGVVAITESEIDTGLRSIIESAVTSHAQIAALTDRGVNPAEIA